MDKKFTLTSITGKFKGRTVYRIRALVSFGSVFAGDLGGFVEKEDNLSQDGNAWISENAVVAENAKVSGNAKILRFAVVYGNAKVYDDAWVSGGAMVHGSAEVFGNAWISGDANICGDAKVYEHAMVSGSAEVFGNARVYGKAVVNGKQTIHGRTFIYSDDEGHTIEQNGDNTVSTNGTFTGIYTYTTPFDDLHFFTHTFEIFVKYFRHEKYTQVNIVNVDTKERSTINIGHIVFDEKALIKAAESLINTIY